MNRMRENILAFPNIPRFKCAHTINICGYGSTLKDTWPEIDKNFPVMTTSGSHNFLISKGIIPEFHVECDPRPHKLTFLKQPHKACTYLIGSLCDPRMFKRLKRHKIKMWHPLTDAKDEQMELMREIEFGAHMIGGGSNAGLRALLLAFHMGYRNFHLFGIDCSYKNKEVWAGEHSGKAHVMEEVECNGKRFWTSDIMYNAAQDFVELMQSPLLHGCHFFIHGESLLFERIVLAQTDMSAAVNNWVKNVRAA